MTLAEFQALAPREARRRALGSLPPGYQGSFDTHEPRRIARAASKLERAIEREPEPRHQHKRRTKRIVVFG